MGATRILHRFAVALNAFSTFPDPAHYSNGACPSARVGSSCGRTTMFRCRFTFEINSAAANRQMYTPNGPNKFLLDGAGSLGDVDDGKA